jgi:hypothetical protein
MSSDPQNDLLRSFQRQLSVLTAQIEQTPTLPADFVIVKFREARDRDGQLDYVGQREGFELIKELPVWDVIANRMRLVGDLTR